MTARAMEFGFQTRRMTPLELELSTGKEPSMPPIPSASLLSTHLTLLTHAFVAQLPGCLLANPSARRVEGSVLLTTGS